MDSDEFNNRYFRNPVLLENGAIYIGEWYYIRINKKGLTIKNTEKVSKSGKMGLFMKGSGKTIKLMLKADLCTQTETYMKAIGSSISLKALEYRYEGAWLEDFQHGRGIECWGYGAKYEGGYKNGMKHGKGKFSWIDGSRYEGEFFNNNIEGHGSYVWPDLRRYEGTWKNNKMNGKGVFGW